MKLKMYAVLDSKADAFAAPFFVATDAMALRTWDQAVNDPNSSFYRYPEDFSLFGIGEFDCQSGEVIPFLKPKNLGLAVGVKKQMSIPEQPQLL